MSQTNHVSLIGNLGKDPEVRFTPSGKQVCNFSVATNEHWKDQKTGEKQQSTEWHRVTVWGKLAELCGEYLKKGRQVAVDGRMRTRTYEKDGVKHYATEVVADQVLFLGGPSKEGNERAASIVEDDDGVPL